MTLVEIAEEIDRTPKQTAKLLRKTGYVGLRPRRARGERYRTYDARAVQTLKGMLGLPHRQSANEDEPDWLTRWLGEQDDG